MGSCYHCYTVSKRYAYSKKNREKMGPSDPKNGLRPKKAASLLVVAGSLMPSAKNGLRPKNASHFAVDLPAKKLYVIEHKTWLGRGLSTLTFRM